MVLLSSWPVFREKRWSHHLMSPCSVASNLYSVFFSEVLKSFILVSLDGGLIPSWNVILKLAQQAFKTSQMKQMKLLPLTQFKQSPMNPVSVEAQSNLAWISSEYKMPRSSCCTWAGVEEKLGCPLGAAARSRTCLRAHTFPSCNCATKEHVPS